jgi:hypothetical protein
MKYINLVFVKHDGQNKEYLFQAPLNVELKAGDRVFCDTMRGSAQAVVTEENLIVPEAIANRIAKRCGAYLPLKKIFGMAVEKTSYTVQRFDEIDLPF